MRRRPEHGRGLAASLLAPVLSLSVVATLAVAGLAEVSGGRVAQVQVKQRGDGVLRALDQRLRDRQKAKQVYAELVATDQRLVKALDAGDAVAAAERLVPLRSRLGLGLIHVYDVHARPLLSLGQPADYTSSHSSVLLSRVCPTPGSPPPRPESRSWPPRR